ncbi:LysM peptidoglycan-binding domain-containing protein [Flavivirga eckloniae]|uniref:LysM domain-containing protein n=1 Tax=Flavivirga eckloniae TaxID=1803846 RepID=A0A2K9PMN8_9FLAO|nr:LysM domain-containing protein [Flavivirga eckloniae]AUP78333.1 hypothetical protein C1H87_06265 [Flavivirga eckloniae]
MSNKEQIEVFFFGSPAEGFTSYPTKYSNLVNGLDKSTSKHKVECKYSINQKRSRVKYIEYGLTGIGQHGKSRGGRNFGVWIEIENLKINPIGQKKILDYIEDFINKGIVKNANIFDDNSNNERHFLINSFNDVATKLDKLINVFKNNFLTDFKSYLEPILDDESVLVDLNPERIVEKIRDAPFITSINSSLEDDKVKKSEIEQNRNSERAIDKMKFSFSKINTLILIILLLLTLFGGGKSSNEEIENYKLRIKSLNDEIEVLEGQLSVYKNKAPSSNNNLNTSSEIKNRSHTVKSGETLRKIVIEFNESNGSNFSTDQIAEFNKISDISKIKIGQEIKFPD